MQERPYYSLFDQMCRSSGWVLGQDKGEIVLGVPQEDGTQVSIVVNEFQDSTGQLALRFWSPVAPADRVPADQALLVSYQLPHCTLGNREGQIVATATRVVNFTTQADLTHLIQTLSYYAHFYGKHFAAQ
ncbi:MAG: hypothetical protein JKY65_08475 [Planctomycetes bacterium]|nr:hypothetical protein [Planctomycetota bacterium]